MRAERSQRGAPRAPRSRLTFRRPPSVSRVSGAKTPDGGALRWGSMSPSSSTVSPSTQKRKKPPWQGTGQPRGLPGCRRLLGLQLWLRGREPCGGGAIRDPAPVGSSLWGLQRGGGGAQRTGWRSRSATRQAGEALASVGGQPWRAGRSVCSKCGTGSAPHKDSAQACPGEPGVDAQRRRPGARQAAAGRGEAQPPARLRGVRWGPALPHGTPPWRLSVVTMGERGLLAASSSVFTRTRKSRFSRKIS